MDTVAASAIEKQAQFRVFTTPYKTVASHAITLDILVPKNLPSEKRPLLLKIHGGGLMTGASSAPGFFAPWIFEYALLHSAIIVAPNYRLLPEAEGLDILADMNDFFNWVNSELQSFISKSMPYVEIDTSRVLVYGDSAGAYLSILSSFHHFGHRIRAIVSAYAMIDFSDAWFTEPEGRSYFGMPQLPADFMSNYIAGLQPGAVITAANPPERTNLVVAALQQGMMQKLIGTDVSLFPMELLAGKKSAVDLPKMFLYHGKQDSAIPYTGTETFVQRIRALEGGEEKVFIKLPDGEHCLDTDASINLNTPWLKEGLEFLTPTWLA